MQNLKKQNSKAELLQQIILSQKKEFLLPSNYSSFLDDFVSRIEKSLSLLEKFSKRKEEMLIEDLYNISVATWLLSQGDKHDITKIFYGNFQWIKYETEDVFHLFVFEMIAIAFAAKKIYPLCFKSIEGAYVKKYIGIAERLQETFEYYLNFSLNLFDRLIEEEKNLMFFKKNFIDLLIAFDQVSELFPILVVCKELSDKICPVSEWLLKQINMLIDFFQKSIKDGKTRNIELGVINLIQDSMLTFHFIFYSKKIINRQSFAQNKKKSNQGVITKLTSLDFINLIFSMGKFSYEAVLDKNKNDYDRYEQLSEIFSVRLSHILERFLDDLGAPESENISVANKFSFLDGIENLLLSNFSKKKDSLKLLNQFIVFLERGQIHEQLIADDDFKASFDEWIFECKKLHKRLETKIQSHLSKKVNKQEDDVEKWLEELGGKSVVQSKHFPSDKNKKKPKKNKINNVNRKKEDQKKEDENSNGKKEEEQKISVSKCVAEFREQAALIVALAEKGEDYFKNLTDIHTRFLITKENLGLRDQDECETILHFLGVELEKYQIKKIEIKKKIPDEKWRNGITKTKNEIDKNANLSPKVNRSVKSSIFFKPGDSNSDVDLKSYNYTLPVPEGLCYLEKIVIEISVPESVIEIVNNLQKKDHVVYYVGGLPRACYMQNSGVIKAIHDIDMITTASWEEIDQAVKAAKLQGVEQGKNFPVYKIENPHCIEITRADSMEDIENKAAQRDFSMNAFHYNPKTKKWYGYKQSEINIKNKEIKSILPPEEAFSQDPIRMLRGIRFEAVLNFTLGMRELEAIEKYKDRIVWYPDRNISELKKWLENDKLLTILKNARKRGILLVLCKDWRYSIYLAVFFLVTLKDIQFPLDNLSEKLADFLLGTDTHCLDQLHKSPYAQSFLIIQKLIRQQCFMMKEEFKDYQEIRSEKNFHSVWNNIRRYSKMLPQSDQVDITRSRILLK